MVEVYNFDSAKLLLKDYILIICISLACCGCYFVLLAFEKSGISGPILSLRVAKYCKFLFPTFSHVSTHFIFFFIGNTNKKGIHYVWGLTASRREKIDKTIL